MHAGLLPFVPGYRTADSLSNSVLLEAMILLNQLKHP